MEEEQEFMHLTLDNYWMERKNTMLKLCPSVLVLQSCLSQALTSILPEIFRVSKSQCSEACPFPSNVFFVNLGTPELIINTEMGKKSEFS